MDCLRDTLLALEDGQRFYVTDEKLKGALDDLAVKLYDDEKDSSVTIR